MPVFQEAETDADSGFLQGLLNSSEGLDPGSRPVIGNQVLTDGTGDHHACPKLQTCALGQQCPEHMPRTLSVGSPLWSRPD